MGAWATKHASKHTSKIKGPEITDVDMTILSLKTQRKKLGDQEKLLSQRIERHVEVAKQLLGEGRKDRALLALKKKKMTEHQLTQLLGLTSNLEDMLNNIETTKQQTKMFAVLKQGNDALKQLQQEMKLEDVQKLMDDTAEAKAYQDELNNVLGQSLTEGDDAAVEDELAQLEELMADQEKLEMPSVPTKQVEGAQKVPAQAVSPSKGQAQQEQEEDEEEELEGERKRFQPMAAQ